jgi:hypothetical protein
MTGVYERQRQMTNRREIWPKTPAARLLILELLELLELLISLLAFLPGA